MGFPTFTIASSEFDIDPANAAQMTDLEMVQTDPHGLILPGHRAAYDFAGLTDDLAIGATHPSLTWAAADASVIGTYGEISAADKGLRMTNTGGGLTEEKLRLPDMFNLRNLGSTPSILLSIWLTQKSAPVSGVHALVGYGYQTSQYAQWYFDYDASVGYRFRAMGTPYSTQVQLVFGTLANDTPTLLTVLLDRVGATNNFNGKAYLNGSLVQTAAATPSYPFNDLAAAAWSGNPPYPIVGRRAGYGIGYNGILHRLNLATVPQGYNALTWIAAERAANSNGARFAA